MRCLYRAGAIAAIVLVACRVEQSTSTSPAPSHPPAESINLTFTYGSEKEEWIKNDTEGVNRGDHKTASGKFVHVDAIPMGSWECIDELVTGTRQADITSPASAAFIKLGNVQSRVKTGKDLIGSTDSLVLSP